MLGALGYDSLDALTEAVLPESIRLDRELDLPAPLTEPQAVTELMRLAHRNKVHRSHIGVGYYDTFTPPPILRNILDRCDDPIRVRAAELLFRAQKVTIKDGSVMAADEEVVDMRALRDQRAGIVQFEHIGQLLAQPEPGGRTVELDVLDEATGDLYWPRSDRFDTVLDLGFTKADIANVTKIFGFFMTIVGAGLGGILVVRFGILRPLLAGAILVASTNLLFVWLAVSEPSLLHLAVVVSADNLSGGLATSAFIAWLSSLTNSSYTATQYALFSSLMTLPAKFIGGFAGVVVDTTGYASFFLYAGLLGVPAILLVISLMNNNPAQPQNTT